MAGAAARAASSARPRNDTASGLNVIAVIPFDSTPRGAGGWLKRRADERSSTFGVAGAGRPACCPRHRHYGARGRADEAVPIPMRTPDPVCGILRPEVRSPRRARVHPAGRDVRAVDAPPHLANIPPL